MNVALGREKADLAIVNGTLLNVYTGELLDRMSVGVKGEWIAYVGNDPNDMIGPETVVLDINGKTIIPGLIDGHTHLAWLFNVSEFLKYAMKGGTTTIITESLETFPVGGYTGVIDFLDSLSNQPIKFFATITAMVSVSRTARGISEEMLNKLLARDDVIGLGESYWQAVLQEPDRMLPIFKKTLHSGKVLEGHSAGARGKKLIAYVASGISSCHEPTNAEEVLERLRLGLHVMIREGSVRRDLEAISAIRDAGVNLRRLTLSTDAVDPSDLMQKGYMEFVVQKAIDCGFDPITAVQMATLNVAEHFSLDGLIGGIAPGKYADLAIIPDPGTIDAQYVVSKGQVIVREGNLLISPRRHVFSEESLNSVRLPRALEPSDFSIRVTGPSKQARVRIIHQVTDLVTAELTMDIPVVQGEILADVDRDILKVAAIDRTNRQGKTFVGLVKGFHLRAGAIASSEAWDTSDIIVVGAGDADMAVAVNRVHALRGGAVVCVNGEIVAELPLPVLGIISDMPMERLAQRLEEIKVAASHLGITFPDPLLTLSTLTTAAIPHLRICEEGLVNLRYDKTLGLFLE